MSLAAGLVIVGAALKKTIEDHIKYADEVRTLSALSETSTEDTSRFIQVLDDYKITAGEALVATRKLTQQGYSPNIDTLAKLSDEYLSLNTVEEKNKFILENLGRGGLRWVEVLNKGSKALLTQGDAVAKNLILTQKMVNDARKAEIAMDQWSDAITGLKTSLAVGLLPALTNVLNEENDIIRARQMAKEDGINVFLTTEKQAEAYIALAKAEREASEAIMLSTGATEKSIEAMEENAAAIKEVSDAHTGMLRLIGDIQGETDDYNEANADLNATLKEQEEKLAVLISEKYPELGDEILGARDDINKTKDAIQKLGEEHEKAMKKIAIDLFITKLAVGGFTDAEYNAALEAMKSAGLIDDATIAMAKGWDDSAQSAADAVTAIDLAREAAEKAARGQYVMTIFTNMVSGGGVTPNSTPSIGGKRKPNAAGGIFEIPSAYGNEGFMLGNGDTASGGELISITPKGKAGGNNFYITVTADFADPETIARRLKPAVTRVMREAGVV